MNQWWISVMILSSKKVLPTRSNKHILHGCLDLWILSIWGICLHFTWNMGNMMTSHDMFMDLSPFFCFFLRKRGLTRPKTYQPGPTIVQMGGSSLIDTYHWIGDISNFSGWAFTNTHFTRKTNNETPPKPSDSSRFQTQGPLFFSDMGCPWSQMLGSKASAKCSTSMDQESILLDC